MGFRIWAIGYTAASGKGKPFHFELDNCPDKSDFEPPVLLSIISKIPASATKLDILQKGIGSPDGNWKGVGELGFAAADIVYAQALRQEVNFLTTRGSNGSISVYCHEKKLHWADANSYVNCWLNNEGNAGKEFIMAIAPGLKKTSLNNFGALLAMGWCVSAYTSALPEKETPHLRITLRH